MNTSQAAGKAKPSFVSEMLENNDFTEPQEEILKYTASTIYGGGADTVSLYCICKTPEILKPTSPDRLFSGNVLSSDGLLSSCIQTSSRRDRSRGRA